LMLGMLNSNWRCGKPKSRRDESSQRRLPPISSS
jgi:hypothetical protein